MYHLSDNKQLSISDIIPHAPQVDLQSKQRPFDQVESSASQAVLMDAPGSSLKRSPGRESPLHQNHGSSHRILLRHSRHPFGRHYSRRSSSNYSDASPSNWKGSSVYDAKLSYKPENKDLPAFPYRGSRIFQKPERIRSSSLGENPMSADVRRRECRICEERLRKNPFIFENSSSTNLSVMAVLVCGHVYHAECLEQETSHENRQDPPCPLCVSQTSYVV
ncbi:RING/U-box superfamily protein [Perilla frutescens var. hirtella]|uniref:RING/U-box superfamily protein n=1 Tax=Perilla frutescens var. hirtella TaxID=608512 RepID=A0AAD4P6M4_PERFH|nr:RING/U-box superfamily protein [Perilla frutescens var. frutescens]KAH6794336.1 RING/U-box superfamily protein [Perilla frutescens var. hirtella]KAH6828894.1 RING/U-box superfamily protein [Perilla frutescens var. hirtella]